MNSRNSLSIFSRMLPHLALLAANLLWAFDYPFYHILLPTHMPPMLLLSMALVATSIFSFVPLLFSSRERIERRDIPLFIVAAILIGLLHKGFIMNGLSRTSPIDGSIINTLGPLLVLSLSVVSGIERLTKLKVAGLVMGLVGALAVILWGNDASHAKSDIVGNLMILGGVASTALYAVWLKGVLAKYRVATVMMWVYTIAAILSLPFGIYSAIGWSPSGWDTRVVVVLILVLLMLTYLPNFLFNFALQRVRPLETSIYNYLQPIMAITISVVMGLDHLQRDTVLFALVIFVGIALVLLSYKREKRGSLG